MHRLLMPFMTALLALALPSSSHPADEITQETKGDQSPAVYVSPGGSSTINYAINQMVVPAFSVLRGEYLDCIRFLIDSQTKKLKELDKKLAQFFIQQTGATDQDANKWVEEVIRNAPEYKKQIQENDKIREEWNREFSKSLMAKVYELFTYIFLTIDSRFAAFQEVNPKSEYQKNDKFALFEDASQDDADYIARTFAFPEGKRILIYCSIGRTNRGLVLSCPSLRFSEVIKQGVRQSFSVTPQKGHGTIIIGTPPVPMKKREGLKDVEYPITGQEMLTEEFKTRFNATFQDFLKIVYANYSER